MFALGPNSIPDFASFTVVRIEKESPLLVTGRLSDRDGYGNIKFAVLSLGSMLASYYFIF